MPKSKKKVEKLTPEQAEMRRQYQEKNAIHLEKIEKERAVEKLMKMLKSASSSRVKEIISHIEYMDKRTQDYSW